MLKKLAKVDTQRDVTDYGVRYLQGTREAFFAKVETWLDDASSPNCVMVISGNAGMGKSVVAAKTCRRMQEAGRLSGSHFCHHDMQGASHESQGDVAVFSLSPVV